MMSHLIGRVGLGVLLIVFGAALHAPAAEAETKPAPRSGTLKSQGEIVELDLETRTITILFANRRRGYTVAEDASIRTHEKESARLEDLKVGDRINFWFRHVDEETLVINRVVPKGKPRAPGQDSPAGDGDGD
jgi:Cu/Ag efflux protein CusF